MASFKVDKPYLYCKSASSIVLVVDGKTFTFDAGEIQICFYDKLLRDVDITADSYETSDFRFERLK